MKQVAKWVLLGWSVFCLIGVVVGMANVGGTLQNSSSDMERTGTTLGLGCGMAMWIGIWGAIALPSLIIYLVAGKKQATMAFTEPVRKSSLCASCGRYYDGQPRFCPNCGQATL